MRRARAFVILGGGRSGRLGRDKPFVDVGGASVLERQLDATRGLDFGVVAVRDVPPFVSALRERGWGEAPGEPEAVLTLGARTLRIVPDPEPDRGPVAGLASAFSHVAAPLTLVLGGDLPFVTPVFVDAILDLLEDDEEAEAVVPRARGQLQPLCAAYRVGPAGRAASRLAADSGEAAVRALLEELAVREVDEAEMAVGDLSTLTRGIDTPEDLAWARELARG